MSAAASAQKIFGDDVNTVPRKVLNQMVKQFSGKEFTVNDLKTLLPQEKKAKKSTGPKKTSLTKSSERESVEYDMTKCDARVWNNGIGNHQCSRKKIEGECMCKMHLGKLNDNGEWWLGQVTEPRPIDPIRPEDGKKHVWKDDLSVAQEKIKEANKAVNLVKQKKKSLPKVKPAGEKEVKKVKVKKAGPKGNKAEPLDPLPPIGQVPENVEAIREARLARLEQNEDNQEGDDFVRVEERDLEEDTEEYGEEAPEEPEGDFDIFEIDGIVYKMEQQEGTILDPNDWTIVAQWDFDAEEYEWESEEAAARHLEYVQQLE